MQITKLHLEQLSLMFSILIASNASSFVCVAARGSTLQFLHFTNSCVCVFIQVWEVSAVLFKYTATQCKCQHCNNL
jgi:hypothetical protein